MLAVARALGVAAIAFGAVGVLGFFTPVVTNLAGAAFGAALSWQDGKRLPKFRQSWSQMADAFRTASSQ